MGMLSNIIKDRLSLKKYRILLLIALCVGMLLLLISNMGNKAKDANEKPSEYVPIEINSENVIKEEKLEQILSSVSGVGKIEVFITYKSTDEKLVLKDGDGRGGENTVMYEASSGDEPFVYKSLYAEIEGIIIVCEGGDRADVKNTISDAVSEVLEIPLHKVKVLKMK